MDVLYQAGWAALLILSNSKLIKKIKISMLEVPLENLQVNALETNEVSCWIGNVPIW